MDINALTGLPLVRVDQVMIGKGAQVLAKNIRLNLSPNVRFRMTVDHEMDTDKDGVIFNETLREKYVGMHRIALERQNGQLKTVVLADGALALILNGGSITIPGFNISLKEIPAAIETLTAFSAFGFLMLSLSFLNAQFYQAVIEQFSVRIARKVGVDPDFITAGEIFMELYVKAFRSKLNIHGIDFFEAGRGYRIYYSTVMFLLVSAVLSIVALHFMVVGGGVLASFSWDWPRFFFCCAILLVSVVSLVANLLIRFSFDILGEDINGG